MSAPLRTVAGTAVPLRLTDMDTDQIIPARFVPYFTPGGLSNALFGDRRDDPAFALNQAQYQGATVLVAGENFGSGSSRESAVWALQEAGLRAVVAPRFGDIFRGNATARGLLTAVLPAAVVEELWTLIEREPGTLLTLDVADRTLVHDGGGHRFELADDARDRLLSGRDAIDETMRRLDDIAAHECTRGPGLPVVAATAAEALR